MTAIHQQKGQHCGHENGSADVQNPSEVGTTLRSACQTWLGYRAMTVLPFDLATGRSFLGDGFARIMRRMVVSPRCSPARQRNWASFVYPRFGQVTLKRRTM